MKEPPEVERRDFIIFVELVGFTFGQPIGVRLAHLIVFLKVAIDRVEVAHKTATGAVAPSARCSRYPFSAARAITAAV